MKYFTKTAAIDLASYKKKLQSLPLVELVDLNAQTEAILKRMSKSTKEVSKEQLEAFNAHMTKNTAQKQIINKRLKKEKPSFSS
jgi:phospholipid N-methyltransferase